MNFATGIPASAYIYEFVKFHAIKENKARVKRRTMLVVVHIVLFVVFGLRSEVHESDNIFHIRNDSHVYKILRFDRDRLWAVLQRSGIIEKIKNGFRNSSGSQRV